MSFEEFRNEKESGTVVETPSTEIVVVDTRTPFEQFVHPLEDKREV